MGIFFRQGVEKSMTGLTSAQLIDNYSVPPEVPSESFQLTMVGVKYCTYDRLQRVAPDPWFINGVNEGDQH